MMAPVPTVLSWSGGKDSALALHELLMDPTVDLRGLLTTVTDGYDRVSMHGVRTSLVAAQAAALEIPLCSVRIPPSATNEQYEHAMVDVLTAIHRRGIEAIAFGDLFLADVRAYRERLVAGTGLRPLFPLWGRATVGLAQRFVSCGFRAVVVCVDPRQIDVSHCGAEFDEALLGALPESTDPCGERGEFHTFVYDGPMFRQPIATQRGVVVEREGFFFCDLLPRGADVASS
ncbi:MAG TPA: diphthine--ammonia ligase [Gemmatimonadaceae bacterium]|jgi:uncharacterized protein (TIGR00290 family)|nr:diphthine--ammonia ligase [Gemmatimonadaceae bacterium]